ncbi:MAG: hypothetical protein H0Z34_12030 [Brevibacillus sp.]|nr:hypothetical protein [Brevibacillus sp.]
MAFKKFKRKFKKDKFWVEFDQKAEAEADVGNAAAFNQATAFDGDDRDKKKRF